MIKLGIGICRKIKHSWHMQGTSPLLQACVTQLVQHLILHILAFVLTIRFPLVICKK